MAKCGCGTTTCSCKVIAGDNVTVTGSGSTSSPYIVSALFDCDNVRTCFTAGDGVDGVALANGIVQACLSVDAGNTIAFGTDGCLYVPPAVFACADARACFSAADTTTVDMTYNVGTGVFSAVVRVDPAGLITTNANGLFLNCAAVRTCFTGGDALNYDPLTGDFDVCLSTDLGNTIVLGTDGCLYVPAGSGNLFADTNTVNLTLTGTTVTADVIIDPSANNVLTATAAGLLVDIVSGPCGLSGQGTAASPLVANVAAWPFACAQAANATDVYCDPGTGQLQGPPEKSSATFNSSGGTTPGITAVPNVLTTVDTATLAIVNPDPCRPATALIVWEGDVTFQPAGNTSIDMLMNGDGMFQFAQTGGTVDQIAAQQGRGVIQVSIPAGGVFNFSDPIQIRETAGGGSTYNRTQWRVSAHVTSI